MQTRTSFLLYHFVKPFAILIQNNIFAKLIVNLVVFYSILFRTYSNLFCSFSCHRTANTHVIYTANSHQSFCLFFVCALLLRAAEYGLDGCWWCEDLKALINAASALQENSTYL